MKCPCCGWSEKLEFNPSNHIQLLLKSRTKQTRKLIREAKVFIVKEIPSETITHYLRFLQGISHIDDKVVRKGVGEYLHRKIYDRQYGFAYLGGIIRRTDTNAEKQLENEIKRYGRTPSLKEVNKKEYNNG